MNEVFELAEKIERKILSLQTKDFINDFIIYSFDYIENEKINYRVESILEPIPTLYSDWDDSLRKLLGLNIEPTEKKDVFLRLEKKVGKFVENNNINSLTEIINNTPYSLLKSNMYEAGCNKYITTITKLLNAYKNTLDNNHEALTINTITPIKEVAPKKTRNDEVDLISRITPGYEEYFETICKAICKLEELVEFSEEKKTYTWNIEKRGNILKLVAFAQALKESKVTRAFDSSAHRCRAICEYFNVTNDIEKQFGDDGVKKCKKFMPPFVEIITAVLNGNKLNQS